MPLRALLSTALNISALFAILLVIKPPPEGNSLLQLHAQNMTKKLNNMTLGGVWGHKVLDRF